MATPSQLRSGQSALTRLAANDLAALWRQVGNAVEARMLLEDVLPDLIRTYGLAASTLAADWYEEYREDMRIAGRRFTPVLASLDEQGAESLARWAISVGTDLESVRSLVEGGMHRRISDWSRQTITQSSLADPSADGWQRVGVGECDFCEMLISRGAVYTEATADFASHDDCKCAAVPAFGGRPRPVKPFEPSVRRSEADQERARDWIKAHLH